MALILHSLKPEKAYKDVRNVVFSKHNNTTVGQSKPKLA